jgi:hypothetical protein
VSHLDRAPIPMVRTNDVGAERGASYRAAVS